MFRPLASPGTWRVLPVVWLGFTAIPARAQVAAWLDFGGKIPGESTDTRHKDWIDVLSFSIGTTREDGTPASGGRPGAPSITEFSISKNVDRSTPALFSAATAGTKPYAKVTLDLNLDANPSVRLELENVLVSGQSIAATTGEDKTLESLTLNFTKITFTYFTPDSKTLYTGYDLATGESSSSTPGSGDSDGDGMSDSWETFHGLRVGTNDAAGDLDGDGLSNLHEYQLGTNPASGTSFFKAVLAPVPATPGTYQLSWNSVAGKTYVIEWSPDLKTPFTAIRTVTASSTTTTESIANSGSIGFYRVRPQ